MAGVRPGGRGDPPEQILHLLPELPAHQAVQNRVQAAVGVRQAHSDRVDVRVHHVVRFIPVDRVEFHQHAPEGDGLVGHPADEEGEDDDGD